MKLIIIHGPPAAGKLTVANALSLRTYFKVFHNHLTIDCTEPVFEFGTDAFWEINLRLRVEVIAEANCAVEVRALQLRRSTDLRILYRRKANARGK